ncbi:MAG: PHP domain-containing protein [Nitrospirae bacterium]|nr:PHP domain-containing protein [Nitrospirota bacterium]
MKNPKKIFLGILLISSVLILRILSFSTSSHQNHQIIQPGYFDYQGVIHFHTNYSGDATGTYEEIALEANREKMDFMISTDHNTLGPLEDKKEGWYQKTLFLVGEELSLSVGYLLALNIKTLPLTPGKKSQEVISDIVKQGGMVFIAHPNHPRWKWTMKEDVGITGEEVLDFADQWYSASPASMLLSLLYYPFNSNAALMALYERPEETIREWDRRNQSQNIIGIFAPDFHQAVRITRNYKFPFPEVEKVLPIAHDHLLLKAPFSGKFQEDKEALYEALRQGHLYFSMDILQNASGFLFSAKQGEKIVWMGDQLPAGQPVTFSIQLPQPLEFRRTWIHLYRNGAEIARSEEGSFNFSTLEKGVYRVEVEVEIPALWKPARKVIWIYSNPIVLR